MNARIHLFRPHKLNFINENTRTDITLRMTIVRKKKQQREKHEGPQSSSSTNKKKNHKNKLSANRMVLSSEELSLHGTLI